ncbi:MAG: hypothetical protein WA919_29180 [Coleofasciculaceae cyanobacterium]
MIGTTNFSEPQLDLLTGSSSANIGAFTTPDPLANLSAAPNSAPLLFANTNSSKEGPQNGIAQDAVADGTVGDINEAAIAGNIANLAGAGEFPDIPIEVDTLFFTGLTGRGFDFTYDYNIAAGGVGYNGFFDFDDLWGPFAVGRVGELLLGPRDDRDFFSYANLI